MKKDLIFAPVMLLNGNHGSTHLYRSVSDCVLDCVSCLVRRNADCSNGSTAVYAVGEGYRIRSRVVVVCKLAGDSRDSNVKKSV